MTPSVTSFYKTGFRTHAISVIVGMIQTFRNLAKTRLARLDPRSRLVKTVCFFDVFGVKSIGLSQEIRSLTLYWKKKNSVQIGLQVYVKMHGRHAY